ncbi:malonyl-ACP O-methyltransferase BioC [Gilvimarinus chinensis]|uniref:malonyl-ACP O-methyltransferase BioC n=1 Tax=Gilvimarinus chinensis TaxID=396005 RepID=UPI0003642DFA|nr:malonyl-ACP O-methyltransferase BioC [Gilvimarinus chinensis]
MLGIRKHTALTPTGVAPIVLLHGWGFDHRSMEPLVEPLRQLADVWCLDLPGFGDKSGWAFNPQEVIASLADLSPAPVNVIGWSLGGALALDFADKYPEKVASLVTLATNSCFVASDQWPTAMPKTTNEAFNEGFAQQPAATLKRFCALAAQGSVDERGTNKSLRQLLSPFETERLASWTEALRYLAATDFRATLQRLPMRGLHLFAEGDALVPAAACQNAQQLSSQQAVRLLPQAGHALHWNQPHQVVALITDFIGGPRPQLDKHRVARSFSKAAHSYESAARLQQQVGEHLLAKISSQANRVLDAGTGTGYFLNGVREAAGASHVTALDLAQGMLDYARAHHPHADTWVCGDLEAMPLANTSVDLIYSSLAVQWCEDLPRLASELFRVLAPGGTLYLATLDSGTLHELQEAWRHVDGYVHVNRFPPVQQLTQALQSAGFGHIEQELRSETLYTDSFRQLARELKDLGAHNVNSDAPRGLTGRERLRALERAYEIYRSDQGLPATYRVCYLSAIKGD